MRALLVLSAAFLALLAGPGRAEGEAAPVAPPAPEVKLDANQVLLPGVGPGWRLVEKETGQEKQIILPAFHPELSSPVVRGKRMAYVGRSQNQGKQQLGCITYDLAKGGVLNRQVSRLFAREGQVIESPLLDETENSAICHLAGERCSGKNLDHCTAATETISLDFEPGSLAHRDLKSAKSAHGKKGKKSAAAAKGATKHGAKHGSKKAGKKSTKSSAKPASKKVAHR